MIYLGVSAFLSISLLCGMYILPNDLLVSVIFLILQTGASIFLWIGLLSHQVDDVLEKERISNLLLAGVVLPNILLNANFYFVFHISILNYVLLGVMALISFVKIRSGRLRKIYLIIGCLSVFTIICMILLPNSPTLYRR